MEQRAVDLEVLRADYKLVRRWWRESEGWSDADLAEADAGIKAAVDGGDVELLGCWANWLAGIAKERRDFTAQVQAMEARMRQQAQRGNDEN